MEQKKPNHSIACNVTSCANHARTCDFCALDKVSIGTHEKNPTKNECVDCRSFVLGADGRDGKESWESDCDSCRG